MMKRFLLLSFLLLSLTAPALAATSTPLNISVDHGVSVTLSSPAASVFIASPDIADVQVMSPTSIMIFGKRTGETTFMATDSAGNTLSQRTVVVTQDLSDLRQELDSAIPGNKIQIKPLPNGIVLTGQARDPGAVADAYKIAQRYISGGGDIINRIHVVGSNQIQLRVRFAEVQRSIDNSLGIDWQSLASIGGFVFGLGTGNPVVSTLSSPGTPNTGLFQRPNNPTLTASNDVLGFSHNSGHYNINGMIDALEQNGLITILAEPTLTAMSGETASFLAGGEYPIPVPQGVGAGATITIEYKHYGVSLEFTPTLISENRINLHVKPEVSQLTNTGAIILDSITVPAITTRKAETTVELGSGESFAIAGLLDNNQAQTVNQYPLLGDMPVLGALFRSNHFQNGQTELVVIITPYIVKPADDQQLALPTDGFSTPSETDRLLKLRYSSSNPESRTMSGAPVGERSDAPAPVMTPVPGSTDNEPATPVAAPLSPVSQGMRTPLQASDTNDAPIAPAAVEPAPLPPLHLNPNRSTAPASINPGAAAPAGPGGFVLE